MNISQLQAVGRDDKRGGRDTRPHIEILNRRHGERRAEALLYAGEFSRKNPQRLTEEVIDCEL